MSHYFEVDKSETAAEQPLVFRRLCSFQYDQQRAPKTSSAALSLSPGGDRVALVREVRGDVRRGWRVDLGGGVKVKQAVGEDAGRLRERRADAVRSTQASTCQRRPGSYR